MVLDYSILDGGKYLDIRQCGQQLAGAGAQGVCGVRDRLHSQHGGPSRRAVNCSQSQRQIYAISKAQLVKAKARLCQ